ncbi:MAG TPA: cytochrome c3 family protein, partial [Polyangia bacterium]
MRTQTKNSGDHLYRITRVIGGRTREDFAGVEVSGTQPDAPVIGDAHNEAILPVSYFFETASFRLKGYSVMVGERPGLAAGAVWNQTCVLCHNTTPYFTSLWGALLGRGAPSYQGASVDMLLPTDRRWRWEVTEPAALHTAIANEVRHLGGVDSAVADPATSLRKGIITMRRRFNAGHLLEIGIGCEACHGGCREHVQSPRVTTSYLPMSPFLRVQPASGRGPITRAEQINRVCARCHQVLFSRYPSTWEGGRRHTGTPGGSTTNSGEARDMLLGGCSLSMSCTTCHDPHRDDDPADLAALATPAGNATCTSCHPAYLERQALAAHAHHDPDGAGGMCINCHMPRKNLALTYTLSRYHRIGSPTERARVESDRPLECALCHARKSSEELLSAMERWWGRHYDRQALQGLYGDLKESPLLSTLARGKPHEQAVAVISLREQGVTESLPRVARLIAHPIPLVRYQVRKTIEAIAGRSCNIDLDRTTPEIIRATEL